MKQMNIWMIDNQLGRRNLSTYAVGELNWKKVEIIKTNQGQRNDLSTNSEKSNEIDKTKIVSENAKIGYETASRVKFIKDRADEATKQKLRSGNKELSINKVYSDLKAKEKLRSGRRLSFKINN